MSALRGISSKKVGQLTLDVVIAVLILWVVWGSTYLAIQIAVNDLPPYLMLAVRFLLAGGLMWLYARITKQQVGTPRQWLGSGLVGVLLLVGGMGSLALAQSYGAPTGMAAVMIAAMPLWLTLFLALQGERTRRSDWLAMAVGMAGVVILSFEGDLRGNPWASALLIVSPLSWALGSSLTRKLPQVPGVMGSAVQMLAAGLVFVPFGFLRGETLSGTPSVTALLALLYLVVFGSIIGFTAYVHLLNKRVRPALMTSYTYVNPVVAIVLGMVFLNERVSTLGLVGMAVVVLSVLLVVRSKADG